MNAATRFASAEYWEKRYRAGGTSGMGSVGRLARYKAATLNQFMRMNNVRSVIDIGCGDASQLELLAPPADYIGVDVSPTALALCQARFPDRRFFALDALRAIPPAELTLSLDVLYHLIEDAVFSATLRTLFAWSTRFVVIYASNVDQDWPALHVRHRQFTTHVAAAEPDWRLLAQLPNPFQYQPNRPNDTSFADFFIYGRQGAGCAIPIPETSQ
jgi:SAM-dependent methyltransferase